MERVDCLFLHVPKSANYYRPLRHFSAINFLPTGILGLADLLQSHDISTEIVHLGVEWIEDPHFSIIPYLEQKRPGIVAFDLQWHPQSFDVMEMVKRVKAAFPSVFVLLGGHTASFYHEEILRNFDAVDGIIRGEAELPLLELAKTILQGKDTLFPVPNLSWRRKGRVLINPLSYVASEEDLNRLCFTHFPLLKNYPTYIRYMGQPFYVKGISKEKHYRKYSPKSPVFHLPVGRGCPVQCSWCSGGISSQETVTGRRKVIFRETEKVLESIREAVSYGYETFHISFDPFPHKPEYFLHLFSRIREEKLRVECFFECYGLPTIDFIKSFKGTFAGPKSLLILSPDAGSDRLRKTHKGFAYTNRALFETLKQLEQHQVFCDLYFTLGIPFEDERDFYQMVRLQGDLRSHYPAVRGIRTSILGMEPGSPWHMDPEAFGVVTSLRNFMDFYHFHSGEGSLVSSPGYWIPGHFEGAKNEGDFEKTQQEIKCRHFCSFHPNPRKSSRPYWGRKLCDLSSFLWKTRDWLQRKKTVEHQIPNKHQ